MISVTDLVYRYPAHLALDGVSFELPRGSISALVGPNGAGKTTLMKCLAGLVRPWRGTVTLAGIDVVASPREAHRHLGFLQDFFGVWSDMTVEHCLVHFARAQQVPQDQIPQRIQQTLALLGLTEKASALSSHLSRGQRQRLAIGQAIVHRPEFLILDEPASGLDPEARIELGRTFLRLRDEGMTLLVSSHILAELDQYADRLLVIQSGKLLQSERLTGVAAKVSPHRDLDIVLSSEAATWADRVAGWETVEAVGESEGVLQLRLRGSDAEQVALLARLISQGAPVLEYRLREDSLQDRYLQLVGGKS
ncbi:MAG: ABC transporter ATP-binding protein [Fibrobacteres bacterium]|jgi:ABC-2 type transport system ATP-binding protein|nr:ABC transporter ATP-binding protein [Fibrobacterota bacterium]